MRQPSYKTNEISPFTTEYMDELFSSIKKEFVQELLSRATVEGDIVLDIPGYRQLKSYTCGYVSGTMVIEFFKKKISSEEFYKRCRPHKTWGISTQKLAAALRKTGIKVSIRQKLTFDDIANAISEGKPVVTTVRRHHEIQHWIVIYGVNRRTHEIFIAGDKFWFTPDKTRHKWNPYRKRFATWADYLICEDKSD